MTWKRLTDVQRVVIETGASVGLDPYQVAATAKCTTGQARKFLKRPDIKQRVMARRAAFMRELVDKVQGNVGKCLDVILELSSGCEDPKVALAASCKYIEFFTQLSKSESCIHALDVVGKEGGHPSAPQPRTIDPAERRRLILESDLDAKDSA